MAVIIQRASGYDHPTQRQYPLSARSSINRRPSSVALNTPFPRLCYNFAVHTESQLNQRTRARVLVRGIVQGVNYRWFTQRRASELGLTGYVRNAPDGSVQVLVEGEREKIEQLLDALRVGPSAAVVESVNVEWHAPSGEFERFEVRS